MDADHLIISSFRCDFDDTAQYRVSAMNSKGELSAFASVVVKSRFYQVPAPSHPKTLDMYKLKKNTNSNSKWFTTQKMQCIFLLDQIQNQLFNDSIF